LAASLSSSTGWWPIRFNHGPIKIERTVIKARQRTHISPADALRLVPPDHLYEVCDEDAVDVDVDVEDEPESDGSADAAHGAAANPVPDARSGRPPAGRP
jgi:hypothetical protein